MAFAILTTVALLLPWLALYLAVGIVTGPLLLRVAERNYNVPVDHLRDTPVAVLCWVVLAARIAMIEIKDI